MVLSVKNAIIPHLASLLKSSVQVLPKRMGCSRSCRDYVQYALIVCVCIIQLHVCLRAGICVHAGVCVPVRQD